MTSKHQLNTNPHWTAGQKIAFRFFFIFLSLQVFTENFLGNWFGRTFFIWGLGEKIFVPPCLWLNDHLFHFRYIPQSWTTFSGSLHTIRDSVYLLISCLVCIVWTILDKKRTGYNKLLYWFSQCLVIALSCITFAYGVTKVFPVQMPSPSFLSLHNSVGDLSPFDLLWTSFGYGKPYQIFSGVFEVAGAILILFPRTRVIGLFIIASVMLNVIMLNYTYQVGVLILSFYISLVALFLLVPYARQLFRFFFTKQPAGLYQNEYIPGKNLRTILFRIISLLILSVSFFFNTRSAYNLYNLTEGINGSRQYSMVENFMVNNDTLKLIDRDTLCWRIWSERVNNGKKYVTIATMNPSTNKTYMLERDTSAHSLVLHPFNQHDTASINLNYTYISKTSWRLDGDFHQKNIRVELEKINPDTTMNLLKTKRTIIIFDDDSDHE